MPPGGVSNRRIAPLGTVIIISDGRSGRGHSNRMHRQGEMPQKPLVTASENPDDIPEGVILLYTSRPSILEAWELYLSELCHKVLVDHCATLGRISVDYDLMPYTPDLVVIDAFSPGEARDARRLQQVQHHVELKRVPFVVFGDFSLSAVLNESLHDAIHTELIPEEPRAHHIREIAFRYLQSFLKKEYRNAQT